MAAIVSRANLAAARIEPALFSARGALFADLTFAGNQGVCTIPLVELQAEMLDVRESSPFIWPSDAARLLDHETLTQIEDALLPWVESLCFNRTLSFAQSRIFAPGFSTRFETAARCGFLGAAAYTEAFAAAAPYVYAARYAAGRRVRAADAAGATGAALLSATAAAVSADLLDADVSLLAREWFDLNLYGRLDDEAQVSIGDCARAPVHIDLTRTQSGIAVAAPVPMDVTVSFDAEDAPAVRSLSVHLTPRTPAAIPLPHFAAAGGSGGRILLLVRDDHLRAPDADTDRAHLLAHRLTAEGFEPVIATAAQAFDASYDLVHICCPAFPEQHLQAVRRMRASGIPVVADSAVQLQDGDALWGPAILSQVLRVARDETVLEDHLRLLTARQLETPSAVRGQGPVPDYAALLVEMQGHVGAAVPAGAAFLPETAASVPTGTPEHDFVLAHAPVVPRSNLFMLARAAGRAGLPLVIAGPPADLEYAAYLKAAAPAGTVFLPEPAAGERAALYGRAKVYADVSWLRLAGERLALAAAAGCAAVRSPQTDPGSEAGIAAALSAAWNAPGPAPFSSTTDPLGEVAQAYARASTSPAAAPK